MKLGNPSFLLTPLLLCLQRPTLIYAVEQQSISKNSSFNFNPLRFLQQFPLSSYSSNANANMTRLAPVVSVSHGGGPLPVLGDPSQASLTQAMKSKIPKILKLGTPEEPKAIVLVTAHWSTNKATISSAARHELFYDYYGFPDEAYELKYDAPGSPEVAAQVAQALKEVGVESKKDANRGWDHGVFIPMILINPKAHIPIVQLSVLQSEDPATHFAIGRALYNLRAQNIAIVGSGYASLHNLRAMFSGVTRTPPFQALNREWSRIVTDAAETESVEERGKKFEEWRKWTGAYEMHPRGGAEHFLPLVVCAGAGGEAKAKKFAAEGMGVEIWSYYWD